jgi:hypothetical protein
MFVHNGSYGVHLTASNLRLTAPNLRLAASIFNWLRRTDVSNCRMCKKSRRDNTLLTVGFSLRTEYPLPLPSPAGTTLEYAATKSVVPAGLSKVGFFSVDSASLHLRLIKCRPCGTFAHHPDMRRSQTSVWRSQLKIDAVKRKFGVAKCILHMNNTYKYFL